MTRFFKVRDIGSTTRHGHTHYSQVRSAPQTNRSTKGAAAPQKIHQHQPFFGHNSSYRGPFWPNKACFNHKVVGAINSGEKRNESGKSGPKIAREIISSFGLHLNSISKVTFVVNLCSSGMFYPKTILLRSSCRHSDKFRWKTEWIWEVWLSNRPWKVFFLWYSFQRNLTSTL